jgi:hypothetical protein
LAAAATNPNRRLDDIYGAPVYIMFRVQALACICRNREAGKLKLEL